MRLLSIAEWLCGETARRTVFEPMLADWQRELAGSAGVARWRLVLRGGTAFVITTVVCLLTGGRAMPRTALSTGVMVLLVSTIFLVAIQIGLNAITLRNDVPFEIRFWMALPMVLPLAIPVALLPALMLMRGTGRIRAGSAAIFIVAGAVATYLSAGWLTPLMQADFREALYEEIDQRNVANDRDGRVTYPWTAVRQVRKTTPEERAAARHAWRQSPHYLAAQAEQTRPRWGRSTLVASALSLAMGALGWALGGLGRRRIYHSAAWWALSWATLMVLGGRFLYPYPDVNGVLYLGRGPEWAPLAVFGIAAMVMHAIARRRGATPATPAPTLRHEAPGTHR